MPTVYAANITNITSFQDVITVSNSFTGGWLGIVILIMSFMILYGSSKHFPAKQAFALATFLTTILSVFLLIIGILPFIAFVVCLLFTCVSAASLMIE